MSEEMNNCKVEAVIYRLVIPKYFSPKIVVGWDISNLKIPWSNVDLLLGNPSWT